MSCAINGNTVKKGITNFLDKELKGSTLFDKNRVAYSAKATQYFAAQEFVKGINSKFSMDVIRRVSGNDYVIQIPEDVLMDYIQSTQEGRDTINLVGLYGDLAVDPESWNFEEPFTALNYPEIDEFTYNKLVTFVKSLHPFFDVKEIDDLSQNGVASLKDFFIAVRTMSKFKAMPEETAHVLRLMLTDDNPLKQEMFNNITSFEIYRQTLAKYKDTYLKEDGTPDYDKIKWEAADKLVAEYITAIATDNYERVNALTQENKGWLKRWVYKIMRWLGMAMHRNTKSYADMAGIILSGKTDMTLKTDKQIEDMTYTDSYFFQLDQDTRYEYADEIISKKPPRLLEVVNKFSREFSRRFNEILKEDKFKELNDELKRKGNVIGKINKLSEIQILLGEVNIDLKAAMDSNTYLTGVKQFLEAIDSLKTLSDALIKVINNKEKSKTFDEATGNIKELEVYFGIYETFKNMISGEFMEILVEAEVHEDIIEWLEGSKKGFETVNTYILTKQRHNLFVLYKGLLDESNSVVKKTLEADIALAESLGNKAAVKDFKEQLDRLSIGDQDIIKFLSGRGRDIDNYSSLSHLLTSAAANGDVYLASISKYIQRRIEDQQQRSSVHTRNLYQVIDPLQKQLNESAEVTGAKISQVEEIWDEDLGEPRKVLFWLNPHKGIQLAVSSLRAEVKRLTAERYAADENTPEFKEIDDKLIAAIKARDEFYEKYMHRPFVKEYYNFRKKYEVNTNFISVMTKWQEFSLKIRDKEKLLAVDLENDDLANEISREKRMRANLLSEFTEEGQPKSEKELKEANILKQFFDEQAAFREVDDVQTGRSYNIFRNRHEQKVDIAIKFTQDENYDEILDVEENIQRLLQDKRLRFASIYLQETVDNDDYDQDKIDYGLIKKLIMDKWDKKNTIILRNQKFIDEEAALRAQLDELQKKGELSEADTNILAAYDTVRGILWGSKDQTGNVNPEALVKDIIDTATGLKIGEDRSLLDELVKLEDYIADQKLERPGYGIFFEDFTPEDLQAYEDQTAIIKSDSSSKLQKRIAITEKNKILSKYKDKGKAQSIRDLINLLGSLTTKEPTTYYWDEMLKFIPHVAEFQRQMREDPLPKEEEENLSVFVRQFITAVDTEDWDTLDFYVFEGDMMTSFLAWLRDTEPDSFDWFVQNHSEKKVFDNQYGWYTTIKWARTTVYTRKTPTLPEHQDIQKARRFVKQRVKNEFRTGYNPQTKEVELEIGKHITNREYNGFPEFLPLSNEDGAPANSPYHNEAYFNLKNNDPVRFAYLTAVRDEHIRFQTEKLPARLRSWNQVPVMQLSAIENIQKLPDWAKSKWDAVKNAVSKNKDAEAEAQAEGDDTSEEIDQFTQTVIKDRIPKLGMSQKIPIERVSRDLLRSTAQFILRAHEFEGRSTAEPVIKALLRVMNDNAFKGHMSNKERTKKFESIYSQMILQEVPEGSLNTKFIRRVAKWITANTALRMLSDPIGGIINYSSAMVNDIIEAAAGKYLNFNDLWKGKILAAQVTASLMADYNKKANLSYFTLIFQTFDFIQGEFEDDLLDRSSSKDKHAQVQQLLMIPRKSGELMAQTAVAMGILSRKKIKNTIDGKEYSVHEIYKKDGNNLALKEGFDAKEWNPIDGTKFVKMKDLIHRLNYELHGNYAKLTQSEASRYAIGKLAENMKRWFIPAFQRRFGRTTVDVEFEDLVPGYYRTTAVAFRNVFGSLFRLDFGQAQSWVNIYLKTPRYQQNLRRMGAEVVQATILFLIFALLLGYAGDDKNKELENNSWIHNTAILVALRVYSETTAYIPIPFPFLGYQEMKRNVLAPFTLPADAISNFMAVGQLMVYQALYWMGADSLEDQLYYKKDSGYWYSEKGDTKLGKYFLNMLGHSGITTNPDQYIRTFDNIQRRLK